MWARTFNTIEELRAVLVEFARHYNETRLVARAPAILQVEPLAGKTLPEQIGVRRFGKAERRVVDVRRGGRSGGVGARRMPR